MASSLRSRFGWGAIVLHSALFLIALYFSSAKAVELGLALFVFLFVIRKIWRVELAAPLLLTVALFATFLLCLWVGLPYVTLHCDRIANLGDSFAARQTIWNAAFEMIRQHWAWGVGKGDFQGWVSLYWPSLGDAKYVLSGKPTGAHNLALHTWSELGLPGLLLLISYWSVSLANSFREWIKRSDAFAFPLLMSLTVIMLFLFVTQWFVSAILLTWWLPLALTHRAPEWMKIQISRIPLLISLLVMTAFLTWAWLEAKDEYIAGGIVTNLKVTGFLRIPEDIENIRKSLDVRVNGTACFYGAELMLMNGQLQEAERLLEQLKESSWYKEPTERIEAEVFLAKNQCPKALDITRSVLRVRTISQEPWVGRMEKACSTKAKNDTIRNGPARQTNAVSKK